MTIISEEEKKYFSRLNEYDRRIYAGMLAKRNGHGGILKVSECLGLHVNTVSQGKKDFISLCDLPTTRQRKSGGGAKKK